MKSRLVPLVILLLVALSATLWAAPAPQATWNAILISWDGVQRDHFNDLRQAGKFPNLDALAAEGTLVDIEIIGHQTDTKAGHTQMLTGTNPT